MSLHARVHEALLSELSHLSELKSADRNYAATGPAEEFESDAAMYRHCADVWSRSSRQLHQLCEANGIRYFHFLQPNQYLPGSKTMGADERNVAWHENYPGRKRVEDAYPLLIVEGRRLAESGVRFTDLTGMFQGQPEATYRDECCHLNQRGNEMLAARVAEVVRRAVEKESN